MAIDVLEINAETGETIERDFTPEELAQREADAKSAKAREKAEQAAIDAKQSALAKLAALGLTPEEINGIIGN